MKVLNREIILPEGKAKILKDTKNVNVDLIVGIRPENISCKENDLNNKNNVIFELKIDVAENLGAETYIYAKAETRNMIIKVATSDNVNTEGTIKFVMDVDKIHLFDREEQNTIL